MAVLPSNATKDVVTARNHPYKLTGFPMYGGKLRLSPQDRLLVTKGGSSTKSFEIYLDLLTDSHAFASYDKQIGTILANEWRIMPSDPTDPEAVLIASFVSECIAGLGTNEADESKKHAILQTDTPFNELCRALLLAEIVGIGSAEITWTRRPDGSIRPDSVRPVDIRRFMFELGEDNLLYPKLLTRQSPLLGEYLPARKFIFHRCWALATEDSYGLGLGRLLYYPVTWKREALTYKLLLGNKHADPALVGVYPLGADEADIQALRTAVANLGKQMACILPEGFSITAFTPNTAGASAYLQQLIAYCDKAISLVLTGEATTGEAITGNQQQTINNSIRITKAHAWSGRLDATLQSTLLQWIVRYNFGAEAISKTPKISRNFRDTKTMIELITKLKELGYEVPVEYLQQTLDMPISKIATVPVAE